MDDVTPERWARIDALFDVALDCSPYERRDFLDDACDDPEIRKVVLELLAATESEEAFLDVPVGQRSGALWDDFADHLTDRDARAPAEEDRIGPYRLLEAVGHGGSSVVYRAERTDGAFDQTVAVKLLTARTDSRRVLERFEHEQQVLADLAHPHVARLYDGGATEAGRPYLVMEYVDGTPLDRYCDENRLSVEERLRLFATVAETVHHAHRNLVVHRDLKPSNILVPEVDGRPQPTLLDFGIAKILDETAPGLTRTGERWMTPEYAAPEQVKGEAITTGTDVYQLGVVLYELITGHRPYRARGRSVYEIERAVCEEAPTPPSTVVTQPRDDDTPPGALSHARATDPATLRRTLRGDLDAIVLKALRKEPAARYASAEALVDDVRRHLDGRPVRARRGSWGYYARKFVARHASAVAGAAAILLLVLGFGLYHTQRLAAERNRAQREAQTSEAVTSFLVDLFRQSSPYVTPTDTTTLRDFLAGGAEEVERLSGQPAIQARLFATLGEVHQNLGRYERSERLLERALSLERRVHGNRHPETAAALERLAWTLKDVGAYERADSLLARSLSILRASGGPDSLRALAYNGRGVIAFEQSRYDAAETWHRRALALRRQLYPDGAPPLAYSLYNLAVTRHEQDAHDEAERLYREALAVARTHLPPKHPETTRILGDLGRLLMETGRYDEAAPFLTDVLAVNRDVLGPDHPRIPIDLNNLASLYARDGDPAAAEPLFREALQRRRDQLGASHPYVATSLNNLAYTLKEQGDLEAAIPLYREAVAVAENALGPEHVHTSIFRYNLGTMLHQTGRSEEAERLYRAALAALQARLPADHTRIGDVHTELGRLLVETNRPAAAESHLRAATRIRREQLGTESTKTATARLWLGTSLLRQETDLAAAESVLVDTHDALAALDGTASLLQTTRRRLVALYRLQNRPEAAQRYRELIERAAPAER
jgi:serine/threonine-protein kinase